MEQRKTIPYLLLVFLAMVAGPAVAWGQPLPHTDPTNVGGWVLFEPLSDEFEGEELDDEKWWDHHQYWLGRQPAFFCPDNIEVRDGQLHITMKKEECPAMDQYRDRGYHTYTSACVMSKERIQYGYIEIEARPMDSAGSSAFWLQDDTANWIREIDVFEIGGNAPGFEYRYNMNLHMSDTGRWADSVSNHKVWYAPFRLADDYNIYALEWNPEVIRWYVNGEIVREEYDHDFHHLLYLKFDSETMPNWFGLPVDEDLPSTFSIKYVRTWKQAPSAFSTLSPTTDQVDVDPERDRLRWQPSTGADSYRLIIATDSQFTNVVADKLLESPKAAIATLRYNETYYWKVGASSYGLAASVWNENGVQQFRTTELTQPPPAPAGMEVETGPKHILIRWPYHSKIDGYRLYRQTEAADWEFIAEVPRQGSWHLDDDVVSGATYQYALTAINAAGESPRRVSPAVILPSLETLVQEQMPAVIPSGWDARGRVSFTDVKQAQVLRLEAVFPAAFASVSIPSRSQLDSYRLSVRFRIQDVDNLEFASWRLSLGQGTSQRLQLQYAHKDGNLSIESRVQGKEEVLGRFALPLSLGTWQELEVLVIGAHLQVRLNDEILFDDTVSLAPVASFDVVVSNLVWEAASINWITTTSNR